MGGASDPVRVPVHYDFASSLCYVAHRVLERLAGFLDEAGLALDWTPDDLSRLMGWRPGAKILPHRLEDVRQIAGHKEPRAAGAVRLQPRRHRSRQQRASTRLAR